MKPTYVFSISISLSILFLISNVSTIRAATNAPPAATYIRKNAHSPQAKADLDALRKALEIMRALPCSNPISWYYLGAMHSIPEEIVGDTLCPSYRTRSDLKSGWDNCTHHGNSELHFLIWHRLFIYHFEKIVRALSGKSDFALPYWDYTEDQYRTMPREFTVKGSGLFEDERFADLNSGKRFSSAVSNFIDNEWQKLLNLDTYEAFNSELDNGIHGTMHVYIGCGLSNRPMPNRIYQQTMTKGLMGNVPSAAFDPIFWVHHSNIDYMWQKWSTSPKGHAPLLADIESEPWQYNFFDENGNPISYTVDQAYAKAFALDYVYDVFSASSALQAQAFPEQNKSLPRMPMSSISAQVPFASSTLNKSVTKPLKFAANIRVENSPLLQDSSGVKSIAPKHVKAKISVSFKTEPFCSYQVYIKAQNDTSDILNKKHLVGGMSFFGAMHKAQGHDMSNMDHMGNMNMPKTKPTVDFIYDVTGLIDWSTFNGKADVQITKTGENAEEITINSITFLK